MLNFCKNAKRTNFKWNMAEYLYALEIYKGNYNNIRE